MSSKDESIADDLNISSVAENSKKNLEKKKRKGNIKPSKKKVDMTEGPFLKKMIFFAIPLILTGFLQWFYNAADLVVINIFSRSEAPLVGAISCTSALTNLVLGMFMGLSVGAGVLVAHYVGAKKKRDVKGKEKERYTHLNAEFQRIARRCMIAFLSDQSK